MKVFISYSWENSRTKAKVLELATKLSNPMVRVILDEWDLKVGHDMNHFMEESVAIADYVLIICDRSYRNKANNRAGGVGIETYIISPDVYTKTKQEKFIPVFFEKDDEGFTVPTYMKGILGITLLEEIVSDEKVEEIMKTIYNISDKDRPVINEIPDFLKELKSNNVIQDERYSPVLVIDGDSLLSQINDAEVKQRFVANQLSINGLLSSINKKVIERGLVGEIEEVELIFSKTELSKFEPQLSELLLQRLKSEEGVFISINERADDTHVNMFTDIISEQFETHNQVIVITKDERFIEDFISFRKKKKRITIVEIGPHPSIDIRNVCSKRIELYSEFNDFFIYCYPSYYIDRMKVEDFEDLIANADDRKHNQLRVYPSGEVFISLEVGAENIKDLQFRWESFDAYNGYVGVRAASDGDYTSEEFKGLKKDWASGRIGYVDYRL